MSEKVVLVGVGEMGGVFARGILKNGFPIYPVTRTMNMNEVHKKVLNPKSVVVSVGEKDIAQILKTLPAEWKDKLVLLQNELLPRDWQAYNIINPTVISIWFEKKQPNDFKVIIPSPVFGPQAGFVYDSLEKLGIPCHQLKNENELLFELVLKNVYILTTNICGLETGGSVGELWTDHQALARGVANDVMDIQFSLIQQEFDRDKLIEQMVAAFNGDKDHKCMGRSAPGRLQRSLQQADEAGLKVEKLRNIAKVTK